MARGDGARNPLLGSLNSVDDAPVTSIRPTRAPPPAHGAAKPAAKPKKQRLVSLDAVRGITVGVMILVDNIGDWFPYISRCRCSRRAAAVLMAASDHSPWDSVHLVRPLPSALARPAHPRGRPTL